MPASQKERHPHGLGFLEFSKGDCKDICFVLESLWITDLYVFIMFSPLHHYPHWYSNSWPFLVSGKKMLFRLASEVFWTWLPYQKARKLKSSWLTLYISWLRSESIYFSRELLFLLVRNHIWRLQSGQCGGSLLLAWPLSLRLLIDSET